MVILCWSLFFDAVLMVISSFVIISPKKWGLLALLKLCSCCHVAVSVLCLFFPVPWVVLQSVIVAFPSHTRMLYK